MSENPLALKYRPKKLSEVIGQHVAVQSISNSFKSKNLHHAYIFGGAMGSGKTSVARIMAAMENCDKSKSDPCGECDNCKQIFVGKSLDVMEIDAASSRGIDDIRGLKEQVAFSPVSCRCKYIILDEAQSLTGYAAEAALKLIEEPPPNVRFILCTTAPYRLKDTVRSRCLFFKFSKINWTDIYAHLLEITKKESISFEEGALKIAARNADGSVRNALQNVQTVQVYCGDGEKLTEESAREVLGSLNEQHYFTLVQSIIDTEVIKGYRVISGLLAGGREAKDIVDGLQWHLRNLLVSLTCTKDTEHLGFSAEDITRYRHQATSVLDSKEKVQLVIQWMELANEINKGLILNLDIQILLENFLVKSIISKRKIEKK